MSDIDGTISIKHPGRPFYDASTSDMDAPNAPVIEAVRAIALNNYDIVFMSGREEKDRLPTERFIKSHFPELQWQLFMRATRDNRKDSIIKEELYRNKVEPYWDVRFVFEDRDQCVKLWRDIGIMCFQVNYGAF